MSTQIFARPMKTALIHFVSMVTTCIAVSVASKLGVFDSDMTKRILGFCVGAIMMDVGNLLPKLRPLSLPGIESSQALRSERFAGWTLFIGGLAHVGFFAFASLPIARLGAGMIVVLAFAVVGLNWVWLLRHYPFFSNNGPIMGDAEKSKIRLVACLLFSVGYILASACMAYLVGSNEKLAIWSTLGFSGLFAVFNAVSGSRRSTLC